jgi:hypothetical protein
VRTLTGSLVGEVLSVDSVPAFWRSGELGNPGSVAYDGCRSFAVSDRDRIHLVSFATREARSIGRAGDGPGEFRVIGALDFWKSDTLVVWDVRHARITWITDTGEFVRSMRVTVPPTFSQSENQTGLVFGDGVLLAWAEMIRPGGGGRSVGLFRIDSLQGVEETGELTRRLLDFAWISAGPFLTVHQPFGPRALFGFNRSGLVAESDGVLYSIDILAPGSATILRIQQAFKRVPVSNAIRDPDLEALTGIVAISDRLKDIHKHRVRVQDFGSHRNSIDEIFLDQNDRLWVQVVDERFQDRDRAILGPFPELRPPHYRWDVYTKDGRRLVIVELDSRFTPSSAFHNVLYGTLELASGERTLGVAELPAAFGSRSDTCQGRP